MTGRVLRGRDPVKANTGPVIAAKWGGRLTRNAKARLLDNLFAGGRDRDADDGLGAGREW